MKKESTTNWVQERILKESLKRVEAIVSKELERVSDLVTQVCNELNEKSKDIPRNMGDRRNAPSVYQYCEKLKISTHSANKLNKLLAYVLNSIVSNTYGYTSNEKFLRFSIKQDRLEKSLQDYKEMYEAFVTYKLINSFRKYLTNDFVETVDSITSINIESGPKGYQANTELKMKDGSKMVYYTEAILAGGYNIQCLHYRYITWMMTVEKFEKQRK